MLEDGTAYHTVVVETEVHKLFTVVIDDSTTFSPHCPFSICIIRASITLGLDGMLLSDCMVWCGSGCVPWSFDARLGVDTFSVECSVTHHSIAQL